MYTHTHIYNLHLYTHTHTHDRQIIYIYRYIYLHLILYKDWESSPGDLMSTDLLECPGRVYTLNDLARALCIEKTYSI